MGFSATLLYFKHDPHGFLILSLFSLNRSFVCYTLFSLFHPISPNFSYCFSSISLFFALPVLLCQTYCSSPTLLWHYCIYFGNWPGNCWRAVWMRYWKRSQRNSCVRNDTNGQRSDGTAETEHERGVFRRGLEEWRWKCRGTGMYRLRRLCLTTISAAKQLWSRRWQRWWSTECHQERYQT